MMSVSIALGAAEARNQNVRPEGANHAYHVAESDVVSMPLLESLFWVFGKTEIGDASEALFNPVVAIGARQLQRTQHAEHIEKIAADLVLAALPAVEG